MRRTPPLFLAFVLVACSTRGGVERARPGAPSVGAPSGGAPPAGAPPAGVPTTSASVAEAIPAAPAPSVDPGPEARRVLIRGVRFDNPTAMAVDDTSLYVESAGRLLVVPKDGSAPPEPLLSGSTVVSDLAVDGPYLYVSAALSDLAGPDLGGILRVDRRTKEAKVLVRHRHPGAIGVDEASIWYGALDDRVWRIPKEGGKPRPVVGVYGTVYAIDVDATNVYFAVSTYGGRQRGAIYAGPRKGGPASVIVDGLIDAMSLRVLGSDLFFNDNGTVKMRAVGGGDLRALNAEGSAISIVRNAEGVFWCAVEGRGVGAAIGAFRPSEGAPRVIATGPGPVGIAVDASTVYWADARAGEVVAMALR